MNTDRKAFNSRLRPVSKKKLESGARFGLKRTPLKPMSDKQRKKIKTYRQIAFETWGERCFICGATEGIQVHHYNRCRSDNRPTNLYPLCPAHHNHMGSQGIAEVNKRIDKKLEQLTTDKDK